MNLLKMSFVLAAKNWVEGTKWEVSMQDVERDVHIGEVFLKANLICKASPSLTNYKIWYVQTAQN